MKQQINEIIKSKDLKEITVDLVEKVLDNNIAEGVIKEIPILKFLIAARNIYNSYTDRVFLKKAMLVLLELGNVSWEERIQLTNDLLDESSSGAEKILLAIDHLETHEKCKVFGRLCKLKAIGEIDVEEFKRLTKLIQDAYLNDLKLLPILSKKLSENEKKQFYRIEEIYIEEFYPLLSLGLMYQEQSEQMPIEKVEPMSYKDGPAYYKGGEIEMLFFISDLGKLLLSIYNDLFSDERN